MQEKPERAADKFANLSVLQDMPANQMGKVMNIMSEALGVSCAHCHAGHDFAKEGVANKDKAREMLTMTFGLNRQHFGGRTQVTCMTCHHGQIKPPDPAVSATGLAINKQALAPVEELPNKESVKPELSAAQIFAKYNTALERSNAVENNIQWEARRIEPSGKQEREVIKLPTKDSWELVTYYGSLAVTERYRSGTSEKLAGDKAIELKTDEAINIKLEAHLALGAELATLFDRWLVEQPVSIDGRAMFVLAASSDGMQHRFFIDQTSGHLRRRTLSMPTVLGAHVFEADYQSYEMIGGQQRPAKSSFRMPGVKWDRELVR